MYKKCFIRCRAKCSLCGRGRQHCRHLIFFLVSHTRHTAVEPNTYCTQTTDGRVDREKLCSILIIWKINKTIELSEWPENRKAEPKKKEKKNSNTTRWNHILTTSIAIAIAIDVTLFSANTKICMKRRTKREAKRRNSQALGICMRRPIGEMVFT